MGDDTTWFTLLSTSTVIAVWTFQKCFLLRYFFKYKQIICTSMQHSWVLLTITRPWTVRMGFFYLGGFKNWAKNWDSNPWPHIRFLSVQNSQAAKSEAFSEFKNISTGQGKKQTSLMQKFVYVWNLTEAEKGIWPLKELWSPASSSALRRKKNSTGCRLVSK